MSYCQERVPNKKIATGRARGWWQDEGRNKKGHGLGVLRDLESKLVVYLMSGSAAHRHGVTTVTVEGNGSSSVGVYT